MDGLRLVRGLARPDRLPEPYELTAAAARLTTAIVDEGPAWSRCGRTGKSTNSNARAFWIR
jgi:hypothetical protein